MIVNEIVLWYENGIVQGRVEVSGLSSSQAMAMIAKNKIPLPVYSMEPGIDSNMEHWFVIHKLNEGFSYIGQQDVPKDIKLACVLLRV